MLIVGLGNILLCDEGVGVHVVNTLREKNYFPDFELVDGGVAGFTLLNILEGHKRAVIVDAVSAPLPAGTVIKLFPHEIAKTMGQKYSLHDFTFRDVLDLMKIRGTEPEMMILGIVPHDISSFRIGLSKPLQEKFDEILEKVKKEIEKYADEGGAA